MADVFDRAWKCDEPNLAAPLRWRKPYRVRTTDLFHEKVPDEWIDRIFAVMALSPQHTFQILTKRPERMREYVSTLGKHHTEDRVSRIIIEMAKAGLVTGEAHFWYELGPSGWHMQNVWLGVSVEDQATADERIPLLLQTPAAIRFVSYEPALGPVNFGYLDTRDGDIYPLIGRRTVDTSFDDCDLRATGTLDWIIMGGESGPKARPMHPDWARSVRDQCQAAGVPFFFKQWGEWARHKVQPGGDLGGDVRAGRVRIVHPSGRSDVEIAKATGGRNTEPGSRYMAKVGKKAAGRLLDGIEHNGFPAISEARAAA